MYKYSLRFRDQDLETQYQKHQNEQVRYPLFLFLLFIVTMTDISNIIIFLSNGTPFNIYIQFAYFIFILISLYSVRRWKNTSQLFIFILNCFIAVYQVTQVDQNEPKTSYINGSNMMIMHGISGYLLEIEYAVFEITLVTIQKILMVTVQERMSQPYAIYSTLIIFGFYVYSKYKIDENNRQRFLYMQKDSQWELILTKLIKTQYVLFEFDEEQLTFKFTSGNYTNKGQDSLIEFLRSATLGNLTLEQYLFKIHKNKQNIYLDDTKPKYFNVIYENQKKQIHINRFKLIEYVYLIVFDEESVTIQKLKQEQQQLNQCNQQMLIQYIRKVQFFLCHCINTQNLGKLQELKSISSLLVLYNQINKTIHLNFINKTQFKSEIINLQKLLKLVKKICNLQGIKVQKNNINIEINSIKLILITLLIELMHLFDQNKIIIKYKKIPNEQISIILFGTLKQQYPTKTRLMAVLPNLFNAIILHMHTKIEGQYLRIQLTLPKEPNLSFSKQQQMNIYNQF